MIGYAQSNVFSARALRLLRLAESIVLCLPERVFGQVLRCHEVARAVRILIIEESDDRGISIVDGKFGYHDHSWIRIDETVPVGCVLDPYAIGRLPMVQLVNVDCLTLAYAGRIPEDNPWRYRPGPPRDDVDPKIVKFLVESTRAAKRPKPYHQSITSITATRFRCNACSLEGSVRELNAVACSGAKVGPLSPEEQLREWVAGRPSCPNSVGECCPDFSCCRPSLLQPLAEREAFFRARVST